MGGSGFAGIEGFAPDVKIGAGNPEALKYGRIWEHEEYRKIAPGEGLAQVFLSLAQPKADAHVIDFGCGTGRGALMLALLGKCRVTMIDFVRNSLDEDIKNATITQPDRIRFLKADLEQRIPAGAEYGFCTDVLEHIPPDKVNAVLNNILTSAQHVFFSISTKPDRYGEELIGEPLHLTVESYAWWLERFRERDCVVHFSQDLGELCIFYVSAWTAGKEITAAGLLNNTEEQIRANVKTNIKAGWAQVQPHPTNDEEVMIVGGGPSLAAAEHRIKEMRAAGVKLVTLNGAYNWALEHGLTPSATCIVDSREFDARFTKPVVADCRYLIASQVHPSVLDGLPQDRTWLWHTDTEHIKDLLDDQYPVWWHVPGGSTVLLRTIPLLRMLGFRKFHLFGCDSCLSEDERHHAYAQPENDGGHIVPVVVNAEGEMTPGSSVDGGRVFYCHPWMVSQAQEMVELIKVMGDEIALEIYGDGLLAHVLNVAAAHAPEEA